MAAAAVGGDGQGRGESPLIPLLVVCGPTASGKTGLAVELARRFDGEVISADSMQVYRHMAIGTAKPTAEETAGIPHHLIDVLEPDETFSVADYVERAGACIRQVRERGRLPIVAGGTGLYISSLLDGIRFAPMEQDPALRAELESFAAEHGNEALWEQLQACDPELAAQLHPNNRGRVIRALEVYRLTGKPMSLHQAEARSQPSAYDALVLGITFRDRERLYERINRRVDDMLRQGLVEEAAQVRERYGKTAAQAIGYKELEPWFRGECSLEAAAERIKMETRRYAKRQLTWFRRDKRVRWLCADEAADVGQLADAATPWIQEKQWNE
ncbi:tRNA (adenosine(37)-N6)-dimethylallyltransferase MiaA [Ruminococcaceae bacterium OttesenSCG-928-L11]|nr:tRNA (adenosine(37)-N6)-dimethylallyltransferase MiaA [Ruminococcaceae bacterium OttesenSCG-928-L11]